jgi:HPt (histidine-containing phosphotransfer) domain-containing protein
VNSVAASRLFDPGPLHELAAATGPGVARRLAELFLRDGPQRLEAMRGAVAEGDGGALSTQAHALAGSSTMVGAAAVAELCELLEQPHDAVARAVLVERVGDAYARTVEPLRAALP